MQWLTQLHPEQLIVFALVLARVSALVGIAPLFGAAEVPAQIRVFLSIALAMLVTPTQLAAPAPHIDDLVMFALAMGAELVVGVALGLGVMVVFGGLQIAGQIVAQVSGISLADVYNPGLDNSVPIFSQLFFLLTLAVFLLSGGDRLLMGGLLHTYSTFPPGEMQIPTSLGESFVDLLAVSFGLGIRVAAPIVAAQLAVTLALGIISRGVPQLNVMALGFGANALVTMAMLMLTIGGVAWAFEDHLEPLVEMILAPVLTQPTPA